MRLINNRYRVIGEPLYGFNNETYIVEDLWNNNEKKQLVILNSQNDKEIIHNYINKFIEMSQIKHKNLMKSYDFGVVQTINLKKANNILYYLVSEYPEWETLDKANDKMSSKEKLSVILDIMSIVDYLHFRGYTYKYLCPSNIYYSKEYGIKLLNLSNVLYESMKTFYNLNSNDFFAPEIIMNNNIEYKTDYYSIGRIIMLLLTDNSPDSRLESYYFYDDLNFSKNQVSVMTKIINNLTLEDPNNRINLIRKYIDEIIDIFDVDYKYDLVKERNHLFLKTKAIGMDKEIQQILSDDHNLVNLKIKYRGCLVKGKFGSGKSKFLKEVSFRLKMLGRQIHEIEITKNDTLGNHDIKDLITRLTSNVPNDILNKYKNDFSWFTSDASEKTDAKNIDLSQANEKHKLFNRISNLISDISRYEPLYLILDDIEKANEILIDLVDYLLNNGNGKLFIILGTNIDYDCSNLIKDKLLIWGNNKVIKDVVLKPLDLESTKNLIKAILGIDYIPHKFSTAIYNESKGNPRRIHVIIKGLYDKEELYLHKNGSWELKNSDLSLSKFLSNFNEITINKLKKYDKNYLEIINAISIFESDVSKQNLLEMVKIYLSNLENIIVDLLTDGIIDQKESEWGYNYRIVDEDLKRYVYSRININSRVNLHNKASNIIMKNYKENYIQVIDELIYQLSSSNNIDLAIDVIIKENEKLANKNSNTALLLWEMAFNLVNNQDHKEKIFILDKLANLYLQKTDIKKTNYYLDELSKLARNEENLLFIINSMVYNSEILLRKKNIAELSAQIEELELLSRENENIDGILQALILKSRMLLSIDDISGIFNTLNTAVKISEEYKNTKFLGSIYNLLGIAYNFDGNISKSIECYEISRQWYPLSGKPYDVVNPINNLGMIYFETFGDVNKSIEYYEQALNLSKKYGLTHRQIYFMINLGEGYINLYEFKKSYNYLKEAKTLATACNDISLIFLSYINLGNLYLYINNLENAYKVFIELEKINNSNPILDGEIKHRYSAFLGEFYYRFGDYELSKEHSWITKELSKDINLRAALKSEERLLILNCQETNFVDIDQVNSLSNDYINLNLHDDNMEFILKLMKLFLMKEEHLSLNSLEIVFNKYKINDFSDYIGYNKKVFDLLNESSKESLIELEKLITNETKFAIIGGEADLQAYLGDRYKELGSYHKALGKYIETLDRVYNETRKICNKDLKFKLINSKNTKQIMKNILFIMNNMYNLKLDISDVEDINHTNENEYFKFSPIINSLNKDQLYDILYNQEYDSRIKTISGLLANMTDNYHENLNIILKYLAMETLAEKASVLSFDEDTGILKSLASTRNDENLPSEIILLTALRSDEPFLFNRSITNDKKNKLDIIVPNNLIAVICIPILAYERKNESKDDKRRWENLEENKVMGYIYLETTRALNRFDLVSYNIVKSLLTLIFLNIENDRLNKLSSTDKLTGTFTRKYLDDKLDKLINVYNRTNNSFSLLMIDIDRFKSINDTFGHLKGDQVLSIIGKTILQTVRETDIVARYGGEEFVVILNNTNIEDGVVVANKIRNNVEDISFVGIERAITISIGLSQYPDHSSFKEELIYKADQALYYAKEILGRNKHAIWYPSMEMKSIKVDKLTGVISGDLTKDNLNILTLIDVSELIRKEASFKEKTYLFLGKILEVVNGEYASVILIDKDKITKTITRKRNDKDIVKIDFINYNLIKEVVKTKIGNFFIDWDNDKNNNHGDNPNWQTVLVSPLIKESFIKGVIYITVPLKEREFDKSNLNMSDILSNIFVGNIH